MSQRLERALAELGGDHEPPAGWEARVFAAIAGERIGGALAGLGGDHEPPPGWQARVIAAIEPRPRRRWWWLAVPAFAVAAVALYLAIRPRPPEPLALALATERTGPIVRGGGPTADPTTVPIGDTLHATATGGPAYRALWIYRGERELVAACPGSLVCREADGALRADLELRTPGTYTIIVLGASAPIAAPTGAYDHDVAAADRAGAARVERIVDVR